MIIKVYIYIYIPYTNYKNYIVNLNNIIMKQPYYFIIAFLFISLVSFTTVNNSTPIDLTKTEKNSSTLEEKKLF